MQRLAVGRVSYSIKFHNAYGNTTFQNLKFFTYGYINFETLDGPGNMSQARHAPMQVCT